MARITIDIKGLDGDKVRMGPDILSGLKVMFREIVGAEVSVSVENDQGENLYVLDINVTGNSMQLSHSIISERRLVNWNSSINGSQKYLPE